MSINPTITLEMPFGSPILDAEDNAILDAEGNAILDDGWYTSALEDVRASSSIHIKRGNTGGEPSDRVADIGTMSFSLDNSEHNSAGLLGYYSPSNDNCRPLFNESTLCRLKITYGIYSRYKFQGIRLDSIKPSSGIYGDRITDVTAVDWMDEASIAPAEGLTVQTSKRDDQLLTQLIATMDHPPEDTDFAVGPDQYDLSFSDVKSESDKVLGLIQTIMMSGLGKCYLVGDSTTGEKLKYLTRHAFMGATVPVATLTNSMVNLDAPRKARSRVNKVIGTTYPVRTDTAATTVLFATTKEYTIAAGGSISFSGKYRDPSGADTRINGIDIVNPPVAGTDYNFASTPTTGSDLNASLGVVITPYADYCDFVFTNNAGVTGYLHSGAQIRGKGIYRYDPITYTASDATIEKGQILNWDMPYQDNYETGKNISDALLAWESVENNERPVVRFKANRNATLMQYAIEVEPMDYVTIQETVTGVDRNYFVDGIEIDIKSCGMDIDVTWYCVPAPDSSGLTYWTLDVPGKMELGSTTILSF